MAIKNLESLYDLVGGGPISDMENQTGPNFPIVGPGVERGAYPFSIPANSQLHAGPGVDQAGRSLLGPNYQFAYGGSSFSAPASSGPDDLDLEGITPEQFTDNSQTALFNLTSLFDRMGPFGIGSIDTIGDFAETTPDQYINDLPD